MKSRREELTLLLLYLTSWEDEDFPDGMTRSWKGYPLSALDQLQEADWIRGSTGSKSVYLTSWR
ncbi:DUF6429 family protein [Sporosarcina gallistercoris]|uniref:DUF6429 family protein n=1 Tax=Sporosarcina gallistercoris TaxID=2762245 RepID=UPI003D29DF51